MKYKKLIFTIIFSFLILLNTYSFAGELNLNKLDYEVTLNSDGTANITETWNIEIEDTNTLFKTFEIDKSKYTKITDVSVTEITSGQQKNFTQIFTEKYHVDKDSFYGLINSNNKFEIAWGVHEDDSYANRIFKINYTVIDAIKNYSDCSEFYWQFINTTSKIPANKVTGTITLPTSTEALEDLKIWAHGPLNGNIKKLSKNSVYFEVDNLRTNTMLEIRIVSPTYIFPNNSNFYNQNKLNSILSEEQKWADEANTKREELAKRQQLIMFTIAFTLIVTNIVGIFILKAFIKKIKKYKEILANAPNIKPTNPSKYYRDIPNETATPADAAFIHYFGNSEIENNISRVISATLLDLCMKKYLSFEIIDKKQIKIILSSNINSDSLPKDEKRIYEYLKGISTSGEFTMKDFEKYSNKHTSKFTSLYSTLPTDAEKKQTENGNYNPDFLKNYQNYLGYGIGFLFLGIFGIPFILLAIIPSFVLARLSFKISHKYNTLTQKGVDEKEAWKGLKNYMSDFSMLDKREVPELVLWEKYLVFATVFGIADKVLKQLKVVYPELLDENYINRNRYSYLYLMYYGNMNTTFINSINNSITNTYNSINYSSGSGFGGGFSVGGGRRWRWWPEWVEDNLLKILYY